MTPVAVSVVVMTKNEEANIAQCLAALGEFDQVFVVDSVSGDRTQRIAASAGATVVEFRWDGRYPKKKQWCLENLPFRHDWVLYVDADEVVTPELSEEIARVTSTDPHAAGYFVSYDYYFMGQLLRYGRRVYKLVLFNRQCGRFLDYDDLDASHMWEVEGHYQPQIRGETGMLGARMTHRDHASLFHFFERHNRYSEWEAVLLEKQGLTNADEAQPRTRRWLKVLFAKLPCRALLSFLYFYVARLGFRDGRAGLDYALGMAFYYWQVGLKRREIRLAEAGAIPRPGT